jgi:hypothetical protein
VDHGVQPDGKTVMNTTDLTIVREFKEQLRSHVPLHRVCVFGSRARGDAVQDSDMDVLVELNKLDRQAREQVTEDAWEVGFRHGVVIVPVTVEQREWEEGVQKSSLLAMAVARDGVEI